MATYPSLCSPCVTYGTLCHAIGHQMLPTPRPREAEDFPRGDRHFKHVPPPRYLICLSPKELTTVGLFKPYGRWNLWIICSLRDSNSFHDKLSILKVFCIIRLATKLDDWSWINVLAAWIREESAPQGIWTLSTISLACWKYFALSVWPQSLMICNELRS